MIERTESSSQRQDAVDHLVGLATRTFDDSLSPQEQQGLARLEDTLARRSPRSSARRWAFGLTLAAGAAAATVLALRLTAPPALTFDVSGATLAAGGRVLALDSGEARIRFSDGSEVVAAPRSRTVVGTMDARGGVLTVERGATRMHFAHRSDTRWTIAAGPYRVAVVGTAFELSWDADGATLDLRLREGAVQVKGPLPQATISMTAGQRLIASATRYELLADEPAAVPAAASAPTAPAESPAAAAPQGPAPVTGVAPRRPGRTGAAPAVVDTSWPTRVARGDARGVLEDAERMGIDRVLSTASRGELGALADAARYGGRPSLARRALLVERQRFPGTVQSHDAAFFLGGLSETEPGAQALRDAMAWYHRYRDEQPSGSYAAEALGREMMIAAKLQGAAAARPLAREVVERFPSSPYAATARKLLAQ